MLIRTNIIVFTGVCAYAAHYGITTIESARITIVAGVVFVDTTRKRIARVNSAGIAVGAVDWSLKAITSIARIDGASIKVITKDRSEIATSGCITAIRGAKVLIIAGNIIKHTSSSWHTGIGGAFVIILALYWNIGAAFSSASIHCA